MGYGFEGYLTNSNGYVSPRSESPANGRAWRASSKWSKVIACLRMMAMVFPEEGTGTGLRGSIWLCFTSVLCLKGGRWYMGGLDMSAIFPLVPFPVVALAVDCKSHILNLFLF